MIARCKVGVLQPDTVLPQFEDEFGDYPLMLRDVLERAATADETFEWVVYDVSQGQYPAQPDECDAYVITGSRASVYDDEDWIRTLEDYVRVLHAGQIKLVGICFGHQMVARALGGEARGADVGWGVGIAESVVQHAADFMRPARSRFNLIVSHRDQVTTLPEQATLHAGSGFCPASMFSIGNHILALQGHPEFVAGYSAALMDMRREVLGESTWANGMASLELENDRDLVARWILNFLFAR